MSVDVIKFKDILVRAKNEWWESSGFNHPECDAFVLENIELYIDYVVKVTQGVFSRFYDIQSSEQKVNEDG